MKFDECGKDFSKKHGQLIKLVLMNLRTPYDVFCSSFRANWMSCKQDDKDFTFDVLSDLLIKDQQKLLEGGKLGSKHQAHLLKSKVKQNCKECGQSDHR